MSQEMAIYWLQSSYEEAIESQNKKKVRDRLVCSQQHLGYIDHKLNL